MSRDADKMPQYVKHWAAALAVMFVLVWVGAYLGFLHPLH